MADIRSVLDKYGHGHLLHGAQALPPAEREAFESRLSGLDFDSLASAFSGQQAKSAGILTGGEPISPVKAVSAAALSRETAESYIKTGMETISRGGCAAVTMAGGQGTRLGFDGPKGCFDIGIGKSLFALQAEGLRALGGSVPWYIMTSEENDGESRRFFEDNDYFGCGRENVFFFVQGMLPMTDLSGRAVLSEPGRLLLGPDGNGGVFGALKRSGALEKMKKDGTEQVFFCGIDNALVRICDPLFLGFAAASGAPGASKSVKKRSPDEKVGVFCRRGGRPCTIEYSELSDGLRSARDGDGGLLYGESNIIAHILSFSALETICGAELPLHRAIKPAKYIDPDSSEALWGDVCKFEMFIFDGFALLSDMALLSVDRKREFAPVKNSDGEDSPATALALLKENALA